MGCIALVQCVLVLRYGLAVVVWYPYAGWSASASACIRIPHHHSQTCILHTDTTPPQPNHNVTPTHIEPEQYNPWNNSTNKSQAPQDGCINIRNMLSIKQWNNKASDIKLVSLYSTIKMMYGPINMRSYIMFIYKVPKNKFRELYSYTWLTTHMRCILAHFTTRLYRILILSNKYHVICCQFDHRISGNDK